MSSGRSFNDRMAETKALFILRLARVYIFEIKLKAHLGSVMKGTGKCPCTSVRVRAVRACTCTDMHGQANVRASSRCATKARLLTKTSPMPLYSVFDYLYQFSNNIGSMGMHSDKI